MARCPWGLRTVACRSSLEQLNREQLRVLLGAGAGSGFYAEPGVGSAWQGKQGCSSLMRLSMDLLDGGAWRTGRLLDVNDPLRHCFLWSSANNPLKGCWKTK